MKHGCSQPQLKAPGLDPQVLMVVGLLGNATAAEQLLQNQCAPYFPFSPFVLKVKSLFGLLSVFCSEDFG